MPMPFDVTFLIPGNGGPDDDPWWGCFAPDAVVKVQVGAEDREAHDSYSVDTVDPSDTSVSFSIADF